MIKLAPLVLLAFFVGCTEQVPGSDPEFYKSMSEQMEFDRTAVDLPEGSSRAEVIHKLGKPTGSVQNPPYAPKANQCLLWSHDLFLRSNYTWELCFDKEGRLIKKILP